MKKNDRKKEIFKIFLSNPLGVVGLLIGLIGIVLAIYFHNAAQENRELCFYMNPTKTTLVRSGQTSGLSISFKGKTITSDVTAIHVVIWNRGEKSIKENNILKPITLYTNGVPVLEAKVTKESRQGIVGTRLDTSESEEGRIGISWDIMEEDDGCIVQLICSGGIKTSIVLEGIIEGQKRLTSISSMPRKSKRDYINSLLTILTSGCIMIGFCIFTFYSIAKHGDFATITKVKSVIPAVIIASAIGVLGVYTLTQAMKIEPPLPF